MWCNDPRTSGPTRGDRGVLVHLREGPDRIFVETVVVRPLQ